MPAGLCTSPLPAHLSCCSLSPPQIKPAPLPVFFTENTAVAGIMGKQRLAWRRHCQSCRVGFIVTMYACIFFFSLILCMYVCVCARKLLLCDVWQVMNKTDGALSRVWWSRHANTGDKGKDGGHCVGVCFFFLLHTCVCTGGKPQAAPTLFLYFLEERLVVVATKAVLGGFVVYTCMKMYSLASVFCMCACLCTCQRTAHAVIFIALPLVYYIILDPSELQWFKKMCFSFFVQQDICVHRVQCACFI